MWKTKRRWDYNRVLERKEREWEDPCISVAILVNTIRNVNLLAPEFYI
jgi:hypothetical protein